MRNCGSHIGQALLSDEVYGVYFGENWISIDKDVDYDKTLAAVERTVDGYPGMQRDVQTYLRERVKEVLTGTSGAIVVRVFGPEPKLAELADDVVKRIGDTPGLTETTAGLQKEIPQINIELDLEKARPYELKPGDVRRQSSALIAGEEVSDIFTGGKAHDVHVWSIPSARDSFDDVKNLPIDVPAAAGQVRLRRRRRHDRAEPERDPARAAVAGDQRRGQRRDATSAPRSTRSRIALDGLRFPIGYHAEVVGEASELATAQSRLGIYGIAVAIVILLLLQAVFGSMRLAALRVPDAADLARRRRAGRQLSRRHLSLGSLVGFLTVFGIAARNGILMISHFQHLERVEKQPFGPELVLRGAKERLAPILMTASATGLAIVPLVYAGRSPATRSSIRWRSSSSAGWSPRRC